MLSDLSVPWVRVLAWWSRVWPTVLGVLGWTLALWLLIRRLW